MIQVVHFKWDGLIPVIEGGQEYMRGIKDRLLRFNHRHSCTGMKELHCDYRLLICLLVRAQEVTVSTQVEQRRFCACYRGQFDVCVNFQDRKSVV